MLRNIPEILPIPALPEQILSAVDKNLAVFIGAGVSRLVGCKGWDELARSLVHRCLAEGIMNFQGEAVLLSQPDRKRIISVCHEILKQEHKESVFYEELSASLTGDDRLKTRNIYRQIHRLKALFLTTNADEHFAQREFFLPQRIISNPNAMIPTAIRPECLYQIHGSINARDTLVFTVRQYFKRYNLRGFVDFLNKVFDEHVVLFLGYGLAEFEILDFLLRKRQSRQYMFSLEPYFTAEESRLLFDNSYFREELKIQIIPFQKDEQGFDQMYSVIESWGNEIALRSDYLPEKVLLIDEVI